MTVAQKEKRKRLPRGWKRTADGTPVSGEDWKRQYVIRAVTIPVSAPIDGTWPELRESCREAWSLVTSAVNWMTTELYARDVRRNGQTKMPKMPKAYLYPETRQKFPGLDSRAASSLEQQTQAKYRAKRYELIWTGATSLPVARYPQPLPITSQAWKLAKNDEGRFIFFAPIGSRRWSLLLRGGSEYRRQLTMLAALIDGKADGCEAQIYRDTHHDGGKVSSRIMLKIVGWFPRSATVDGDNVMPVRTDGDSFLAAFDLDAKRIWWLNADHVRRMAARYSRDQQRLAEDTKHERRTGKLRERLVDRRHRLSQAYQRLVKDWSHQASAQLVEFAKRRRISVLKYDDSDASYLPKFPWFSLRTMIAEKCGRCGIEFVHASGDVAQETPGPLASDVSEGDE